MDVYKLRAEHSKSKKITKVRIPVNVTDDSGSS
jgi:hypothetical protein